MSLKDNRKLGDVKIIGVVMSLSDGWRVAPVKGSLDGKEAR